MTLAKLTLSLRHSCIKLLAPKLYADWTLFYGQDSIEFERPMVSFLKKYFGNKLLIGCEIGVREGINAFRILKNLNVSQLYLIDPYLPYYEPLIPESLNADYHKGTKDNACKLLNGNSEKIVWVYETSDNALQFVKGPLDFCYIDGSHEGDQVKKDIENYGQLIRSGGVLGGHDFNLVYKELCASVLNESKNGVWRDLSGSVYDWWLIKN
jgi:hypothetical protein